MNSVTDEQLQRDHPRAATLESILDRVDRTGTCWNWTGYVNPSGYGRSTFRGKRWLVHRIVYTLTVGPIGDAYLDHLCRNRLCCRPDHLEPVTALENARRGHRNFDVTGRCQNNLHDITLPGAICWESGIRKCRECRLIRDRVRRERLRQRVTTIPAAPKTHCKYGHEYTPQNTYTYRGKRFCRKCCAIRGRAYVARKRSSASSTERLHEIQPTTTTKENTR